MTPVPATVYLHHETPEEVFSDALSYVLESEPEWVARELRGRFEAAMRATKRLWYLQGKTDTLNRIRGEK